MQAKFIAFPKVYQTLNQELYCSLIVVFIFFKYFRNKSDIKMYVIYETKINSLLASECSVLYKPL